MLWKKLDLHLFDGEGGDASGATPAAAAQDTTGENTADAGQGNTETKPDRNAEFRRMITGDYKDVYDAEVNKILNGRLKKAKATESQLAEANSFIQKAAARYGKDPTDLKGLGEAFDADDSYWLERAEKAGTTVEQEKHLAELEFKDRMHTLEAAKAQKEAEAQAIAQRWEQESEALKTKFPNFDFSTEMESNKTFHDLVLNGANVENAYFSVHMDEILSGAMHYTAAQVKQSVANNIQARGSRPSENGSSSQATATTKIDPSKLTLKQMKEMEKEFARTGVQPIFV